MEKDNKENEDNKDGPSTTSGKKIDKVKPPAYSRRDFLKASALVAGGTLLTKELLPQSVAYKQAGNNNHVIDLQSNKKASPAQADFKIDFYGHCAFKITSPQGLTMLFDPWRNDPTGAWGLWYPKDFPREVVDIVLSTHAHFDHDAIDKVDATMVLDRMVGSYQFADVKITGIADKHACVAPGSYKWTNVFKDFGTNACPPNNPGNMDMVMYVVEIDGLRILIWGDNRHNPSKEIWEALGRVDVLTLPVDGSEHILSYEQADNIVKKLSPSMVIPTHYLCEGVSITLTTLETADEWVNSQKNKTYIPSGSLKLNTNEIKKMREEFFYFGSNTLVKS